MRGRILDLGFCISGFRDCKKGRILYTCAVCRDRGAVGDVPGGWLCQASVSKAAESGKESLNFKVSLEFKREFKGFAVSEGISMTDLLKEGFALSKEKRQE